MANGKFKPGRSGNTQTQFKAGNRHRWQPGQSGNPTGIAQGRLQFEERFYTALLEGGSAEEASSLLWTSARKREPWAIQALLQRLAPEAKQIQVTHGIQHEPTIDYSRLTNEELSQLEQMLERATVPTGPSEEGESAPQSEGVRDPGVARTGTEQ